MNKAKRPMTNRLAKKIKKEVHSAQKSYPARGTSAEVDTLTERELKKRFPTRKAPKAVKRPAAPKKKVGTKLSKRTTPGTVPSTSSPASIHREGGVWAKTVVKQNLNRTKTLAKKMGKRK